MNYFQIFLLFCLEAVALAKPKYLRPCYFTNWAHYRPGRASFQPEDYVPGLCTHIFYAFGYFNSSFEPTASDASDLPNDSDSEGLYARVNALKEYDPGLKTVLSFGGWTFSQTTTLFSNMTASRENRATFINASIAYLRRYGFDGIDFDWEYPDSKQNFNALLKEYRKAAKAEASSTGNEQLIIAAAVSASISTANNSYDIATMAKYVDFVNLMSYDFHGSWETVTGHNAPLYSNDSLNIASAAEFWVQQGMPRRKVVIGIPTYGQGWTLRNPQNQTGVGAPATGVSSATEYVQSAGTGAYFEFCEMLANGSAHYRDPIAKVPYLIYNNTQWFSYEDAKSVHTKAKWVKKHHFGGAYVWTLDFDDFNGECPNNKFGLKFGLYPLVRTIARVLGNVYLSESLSVSML